MKDTGHIAFSDGTFEHFGCIGFGVSCVDDQWKSGLPSGVDMRFEATALGITDRTYRNKNRDRIRRLQSRARGQRLRQALQHQGRDEIRFVRMDFNMAQTSDPFPRAR